MLRRRSWIQRRLGLEITCWLPLALPHEHIVDWCRCCCYCHFQSLARTEQTYGGNSAKGCERSLRRRHLERRAVGRRCECAAATSRSQSHQLNVAHRRAARSDVPRERAHAADSSATHVCRRRDRHTVHVQFCTLRLRDAHNVRVWCGAARRSAARRVVCCARRTTAVVEARRPVGSSESDAKRSDAIRCDRRRGAHRTGWRAAGVRQRAARARVSQKRCSAARRQRAHKGAMRMARRLYSRAY